MLPVLRSAATLATHSYCKMHYTRVSLLVVVSFSIFFRARIFISHDMGGLYRLVSRDGFYIWFWSRLLFSLTLVLGRLETNQPFDSVSCAWTTLYRFSLSATRLDKQNWNQKRFDSCTRITRLAQWQRVCFHH